MFHHLRKRSSIFIFFSGPVGTGPAVDGALSLGRRAQLPRRAR